MSKSMQKQYFSDDNNQITIKKIFKYRDTNLNTLATETPLETYWIDHPIGNSVLIMYMPYGTPSKYLKPDNGYPTNGIYSFTFSGGSKLVINFSQSNNNILKGVYFSYTVNNTPVTTTTQFNSSTNNYYVTINFTSLPYTISSMYLTEETPDWQCAHTGVSCILTTNNTPIFISMNYGVDLY